MRAFLTAMQGRIRRVAVAALVGTTLACTGDGPAGAGGVRRLELAVPSDTLRPGFVVQATATPFDAKGQVVEGRPVLWRSLTPATLAVSAEGLLFALAPGTGIARASVGNVSAEISLSLVNPPVASLTLDADTVRLLLPAGGRALHATARDAAGIEILGVPRTWESSAGRIAAVSSNGEVSAQAVGTARVTARAESFAATAVVEVGATVTPGGPAITQVSPGFVAPGQVVALAGTGFGPTPAANSVLLDGVPVAVTSATSTQLFLALPAAAAFACEPTRTVAVQVTTSTGIGVAPVTLQVAAQRSLAVGQSLVFATLADARCNEFAPEGGRYLLTVQNATRAVGSGDVALTVSGVMTGGSAATQMAPPSGALRTEAPRRAEPPFDPSRDRGAARRSLEAHARVMEANRALLASARPPAALRQAPAGAHLDTPAPGAVLPVRIAALGQPNLCNTFTNIGGRAVFVGDHVVILEDTASAVNGQPTLHGQMDNLFTALGVELETTVWPIVQQFGDPLVMDSRLDANGRVFV
ncbi:MAG: IPT/TIG domain-containing protein, partial [Gemmatimonadota bacterium]|nr:IPT/TIG domain-containing protein [Gemmatimonadota bacterium]